MNDASLQSAERDIESGPADPSAQPSEGDRVDDLIVDWLSLPEVATLLGLDITRTRQLLRDHQLVALRSDGVLRVPAALIHDGHVVKGLSGVLTLLGDARYTDEEAVRWLFRPDESLPGTPAQALRENRGTEVKRRAQALGF